MILYGRKVSYFKAKHKARDIGTSRVALFQLYGRTDRLALTLDLHKTLQPESHCQVTTRTFCPQNCNLAVIRDAMQAKLLVSVTKSSALSLGKESGYGRFAAKTRRVLTEADFAEMGEELNPFREAAIRWRKESNENVIGGVAAPR
uniref:Uncharacterized protein n=1 Tax=Vespula pensylvanica TaxID=30213 RepID=A0A834N187_VESPE|nr:hypothetical protein H0235_017104 [Vespula pensylvanica]